MIKDTLTKFKKRFTNYNVIGIGDVEVDDLVNLDDLLEVENEDIFIENCVFNQEFLVSTNRSLRLSFNTVEFNGGIRFEKANIYTLNIDNCKIKNFIINESTFENLVNIETKTEINFLKIEKSRFNTSFIIRNSKVFNFNGLLQCPIITSLEIINSEIYGRLETKDSTFNNLILNNSTFHSHIWLLHSTFGDKISVYKCKFLGNLNILICKVKDFYIEKSSINNLSIKISRKSRFYSRNGYESIRIKNTSFQDGCIIEDEFNDANEISINSLELGFGSEMKGEVFIKQIIANEILLNGNNYNSEVLFDNVNANNILIEKFSNYKSLQFFNLDSINEESNFEILKSNLGNTHFNYCNLSNYNKIEIKQSNISGIIASGVNWFNYISIVKKSNTKNKNLIYRINRNIILAVNKHDSSDKNVIEFNGLRELFRQLKFVMERQGNKIQALEFKQYEMQAYKQELKLTKRFFNLERIILWANQSNDHGQNWFKPILLGVIFTILFLWLIILSSSPELSIKPSFNISDVKYTLSTFWENLKYFPNLMNPAYRLKDIFIEQNFVYTFGSYFWALIQRISIAFFIYQTITAFRKYGSK